MTDAARRFRASRWATATLLLGLPLLIALGAWQVVRLEWKTALIARMDERLAQPPSDLPFTIHVPEAFDYAPAQLLGRYQGTQQLVLTSRVRDGAAGAELIAGFTTLQGQAVVVARGWVPDMQPDPGDWPLPEGVRRLTGVLRLGDSAGWFTPQNDGVDRLWYWRDLPAMAGALSLSAPLPLVLHLEDDSAAATPGTQAVPASASLGGAEPPLPQPGSVRIDLPNNHLVYAVTWFSLAVALVVIYVLHGYRRGR